MELMVEFNLDEWTAVAKALIIMNNKCKEKARMCEDAGQPDAKLWGELAEEYQNAYKRMQNAHTAACEKLLDEMKEMVNHEKH